MTEKVLDSASTWDQCFLNDLLVGAGSEGVISDSNPGWSDDGAAHRMNCDTPPLKGLRLEPFGSIRNHSEESTRCALSRFHPEPEIFE